MRRRLQSMLVVVALVGALLPFSPAEALAAETSYTFVGGGFGHSVGMSQFGAYGMALDGYSWEEITGHYFTDTVIADIEPVLLESNLFVGLRQEQTAITFVVRSTGAVDEQAGVTFRQGDSELVAEVGDKVTIRHIGDGTCRITSGETTIEGTCQIDADWDGFSGDPTAALEIASCTQPNWNAPGGTVYQPCMYARGGMRIRHDNNTQAFNVSVEVGLEDYVLGISESPYAWGSTGGMAALQAQAAAARSYAVRRAVGRGAAEERPWCHCTLLNSTVDQYYVGWGHGTSEWIEAVETTDGRVIVYPGDIIDGVQMPIEAFYSSSTFGWTESSEHGFGAYVPYLRSVDDHWSQMPSVGNHSARWERTLTASNIASRLPGMSTVTGMEVATCSTTGAALSVTFHGSGGPLTFPTSDLRVRLGLRSQQIINLGAPPPDSLPCSGPGLNLLPEGGPVALARVNVDDDSEGDSTGDGDGMPEAGETIEISTSLVNQG
ncbi:SpoIID/LytB domain-containing protein, partial [bacterium]|nr:SpoIID/LytB domain-containing protein [bacterium]